MRGEGELTWRRPGGVGGDHDGRGGDGAVGDVNFDLVTRARVQATHVEVWAHGGDVGEERPVLQVNLPTKGWVKEGRKEGRKGGRKGGSSRRRIAYN